MRFYYFLIIITCLGCSKNKLVVDYKQWEESSITSFKNEISYLKDVNYEKSNYYFHMLLKNRNKDFKKIIKKLEQKNRLKSILTSESYIKPNRYSIRLLVNNKDVYKYKKIDDSIVLIKLEMNSDKFKKINNYICVENKQYQLDIAQIDIVEIYSKLIVHNDSLILLELCSDVTTSIR